MKRITRGFIVSTLLLTAAHSYAADAVVMQLMKVRVFSLGENGFIAKKMPELMLYEQVASRHDAVSVFRDIMRDPQATPESKLYAACGLWDKGRDETTEIPRQEKDATVTILQGDILHKADYIQSISGIKTFGCQK